MNETKDTIDNISQHTSKVMMSVDSPVIYSQSGDREHLQGVIDKTKHLSVEPKPDAPIEGHQSEPSPSDVEPGNAVKDATDVTLDNSKKGDELNGTHKGALGFDSGVNRTQEIGTCDSPELSQVTSNMTLEQQTGGLVSTEEHAAALERIKHLEEVNEKLSKEIQESHVNNQQSVKAVAESGQTSLKEVVDDDVNDDAGDSKEEWIEDIIPAIYSNERMNKNGRLKIQTHMKSLWLNIEPKELIIELHSLLVFDEDEFDYLLDYVEEKGRSNGALKMLRKLYRKGPNSYILFLVALERCNHTWVIKTLEPDCVICEGRIKYSGQKYYELIDNTSPKYREFVRRCEKNIEDVYDDHPGHQFVVVKKLAKGCVEVTFHLISLGYNNEENLRRTLEDLVKSGFIDTDPVKPDEFYFRQITDEELASDRESMTQRRISVLEKEIETLKLQINELRLENAALRATSANAQEVETYKEHLAKKYTDTLQDKELIISSLQEQLGHQATVSNVDIDRADGERLEKKENDVTILPTNDDSLNEQLDRYETDSEESIDRTDDERLELEKEMTIVPIDDYQDKERLHQGKALTVSPVDDDQDKVRVETEAGSSVGKKEIERSKSAGDQGKIEQILVYLVTFFPDKLRPLVQSLKYKLVIDIDESKLLIRCLDIDNSKYVVERLSKRVTSNSDSNYYQYVIGCVRELGLSDVVDMFDEGSSGEKSVEYQRKIRQILVYLVTCHPDELRPLVQLLKDKDVIDDDEIRRITMYIDRHDIKQAAWMLSEILNYSPDPSSYPYLKECLKMLDLSDVKYMIDIVSTVEYQGEIKQITDYLVTDHPDKLRPLVKLLKNKGALHDGDRNEIIMCIDRDDIKIAAWMLTEILIYTSGSKSYQYLKESIEQLGSSDVEDMVDKGDLKKQKMKNISTGFSAHTSQNDSQPLDLQLQKTTSSRVRRLQGASIWYRKKIEQIIDYLVTCHPDKVRPLVELLKDKDVIDDDDSKQIIMYIDKDDIKLATPILTSRLISRPNSYQCFVECVKELGLSDTLDMNDKGDVDILTSLGTKKSGLMRFEEQDLKKQETKNISTGFSVHTSHSRSSPE